MKVMQSFLMLFYILDQCFELCAENDLGGLLGIISPELWQDGRPIDGSVMKDWQQISNPKDVNADNIIDKITLFLCYYEEEFGFHFSDTKRILFTLKDSNIIEKAIIKTQEMYLKYDYYD